MKVAMKAGCVVVALLWCVTAAAAEMRRPLEIVRAEGMPVDNETTTSGERWQTRVPLRPLMDVPLRDVSVCRGPEGLYYMTGTRGQERGDGTVDFRNDRTVRLWKSADMVDWEPVGTVWNLKTHPDLWKRWQRTYRIPPDRPGGPRAWGLSAPEVHYVKDSFWIAFSMNGRGTGLLKSTTGEAKGPYEFVGQMTTLGDDPSLFRDDDGKVYWLYDGGWIARMKEDMSGLAERPRLLQPETVGSLTDYPRRVGSDGAFMFKVDAKYHLACADHTERLGGESACYETFVAVADDIYGPYSIRYMMIPHGGQTTVFRDNEERLYATFCAQDEFAVFRDRASIVPLVKDNFLGHASKRGWVITEGGTVGSLKPIELPGDYGGLRDPHILLAPDGNYYLTGTTERQIVRCGAVRVWRSPDLKTWETVGDEHGAVWYCDQAEWSAKWIQLPGRPDHPEVRDLWGPDICHLKGTYYIPFGMFSNGAGVLKSTSGEPEGPYECIAGPLDWTADVAFFEDDAPSAGSGQGGTIYMVLGFGVMRIAVMNEDLTGFREGPKPIGPSDGSRFGYEGVYMDKMNGKYVLFYTDWHGEPPDVVHLGSKERYHNWGTYDFMYCSADEPTGPYSRPRLAVPHGGASSVFKDKAGYWWATMFGSDRTAPFQGRLGLVPLELDDEDGELIIRVEQNPDAHQRDIMRVDD